MNKKKLLLIPTLLIFSLSAFGLTACNHPDTPKEKADWVVHKISKSIDLREDQIAKLDDVKNEMMKHHKEHKAKKAVFIDNLIAEIQKPSIDPNFFMGLVNQFKSDFEHSSPPIIAKMVTFHESLTVEQKTKLVEMIKKHHQNHAS